MIIKYLSIWKLKFVYDITVYEQQTRFLCWYQIPLRDLFREATAASETCICLLNNAARIHLS